MEPGVTIQVRARMALVSPTPLPLYLEGEQGMCASHRALRLHLQAEWGGAPNEQAECIQEAMKRQ